MHGGHVEAEVVTRVMRLAVAADAAELARALHALGQWAHDGLATVAAGEGGLLIKHVLAHGGMLGGNDVKVRHLHPPANVRPVGTRGAPLEATAAAARDATR